MQSRLLLNVVVRQSTAIFQLLASKDQPLLVWGNSLLVLNLGLDILNSVRGLDFKGDSLAGQGLDENLHATSQTKDQMKCRFLLDVVVGQSTAIFQLLASKDQPLLVWGDPLLVLDLGFDILNGVRGFHLKGDGLSSQGLNKNLHTTTQSEDKVKSRLLLDIVVRKGASILKLLATH